MGPGDVILARLPAAPGKLGGLRPALVVAVLPGYFPALLVCGISSRIGRSDPEWDIQLSSDHGEFEASGLKTPSVIRPSWLETLSVDANLSVIGHLSGQMVVAVRQRIVAALTQPPP